LRHLRRAAPPRQADKLIQGLVRALQALKLGQAADATSAMGPMIDKANVAPVNRIVEKAIAGSAEVVLRGGPVTEGPLAAGAFYLRCLGYLSRSLGGG